MFEPLSNKLSRKYKQITIKKMGTIKINCWKTHNINHYCESKARDIRVYREEYSKINNNTIKKK